MSFDDTQTDRYEAYAETYDSLNRKQHAQRTRRKRKPRQEVLRRQVTRHLAAHESAGDAVAEVAEADALEQGFVTSYHPGHFEQGWLLQSLQSFYQEGVITDVLALVRGGKEANVYCCAADPDHTGETLLAAKVYRPRMLRHLRNDSLYRERRQVLTAEGRAVKGNEHRILRALGKKTAYGQEVAQTSWLMYEYTTLQTLHAAGAAVPRPVAVNEQTILMGYVGDRQEAAPTLNQIRLDRDEAEPLFREVLRNVELMLRHGMVHGDLSAYNLLYWDGRLTLIDFPQVIDPGTNASACAILARDLRRVCEYFARQGVAADPAAIADDLWRRYAEPPAHVRAADAYHEPDEE